MNLIKRGNDTLGIMLRFKYKPKALKISNTALDGTPYVQNPGKATDKRESAVFCDSYEKKHAMDEASNDGALLTVLWEGTTVRGYIENDSINWKEWRDGHGVGQFTLIVKEVVE